MGNPAPNHQADNQLSPLKLRHIAAYGAGDFGFAVIYHMVSLFLLYFYTDIYGTYYIHDYQIDSVINGTLTQ